MQSHVYFLHVRVTVHTNRKKFELNRFRTYREKVIVAISNVAVALKVCQGYQNSHESVTLSESKLASCNVSKMFVLYDFRDKVNVKASYMTGCALETCQLYRP